MHIFEAGYRGGFSRARAPALHAAELCSAWTGRRPVPTQSMPISGFEDYAFAGAAVHYYAQGGVEAEVADASGFFNAGYFNAFFFDGGLRGQPVPVDEAFAGVGIDGEVSDLKGGEVLEEVRALRRSDAEVAESGFDDGTGAGDFVPFDGNAEPGLVRSPAADADQQVGRAFGVEQRVEVGDALGDFLTAGALEAVAIDDDDVAKVLDAAVAEDLGTLAEQAFGFDLFHTKLFAFVGENQRTNLQEAEVGYVSGALGQADGEFDLDGAAEGVFADAGELVEDRGKGKDTLLQNGRERSE